MRFRLLLIGALLPACMAVKDTYKPYHEVDAAKAKCWDLPRDKVYETAKGVLSEYRKYRIEVDDPAKGRLATFERNEDTPSRDRDRRHKIIVQLTTTEQGCTKVLVTAPQETWTHRERWEDLGQQAEGIRNAAQLEIDAKLKAPPAAATPSPSPAATTTP